MDKEVQEKPNRYAFHTLCKVKIPLSDQNLDVKILTGTNIALSPVMLIKIYALYASLASIMVSLSNPQHAEDEAVKHAELIARWAGAAVAFALFTVQNQIVISYKFTPIMIKEVKRDIKDLTGLLSRTLKRISCNGYQELDEDTYVDHFYRFKKVVDYTLFTCFSILHGLFGYISGLELLGTSIPAKVVTIIFGGIVFPLILLPLRYAHGLASHEHDHDHEHHDGCNCVKVKKVVLSPILYAMVLSVFLYESGHVVAWFRGDLLTHNTHHIFKSISQNLDMFIPLGILSALGAIPEAYTEVQHLDEHKVTLATRNRGYAFLNKTYAVFSAFLSDHMELFILMCSIGLEAKVGSGWQWFLGAVGLALTGMDSYFTGEMHAYGIPLWQVWLQYICPCIPKMLEDVLEEGEQLRKVDKEVPHNGFIVEKESDKPKETEKLLETDDSQSLFDEVIVEDETSGTHSCFSRCC